MRRGISCKTGRLLTRQEGTRVGLCAQSPKSGADCVRAPPANALRVLLVLCRRRYRLRSGGEGVSRKSSATRLSNWMVFCLRDALASRLSLHLKESPPWLYLSFGIHCGTLLAVRCGRHGTMVLGRSLFASCPEPVPGLFTVFSVPGRLDVVKEIEDLFGTRTCGSQVCALDATEIWGQLLCRESRYGTTVT